MFPSGVTSLLAAVGSAWFPILVDAAIKGSAILAMACIASLFVRRASAATRHLVWFLAMASLLAMPALSWVLPGWQVLPGWVDVARPAAHDAPAPEPPYRAPATGVAEPAPIPDRPLVAGDPPAPPAPVPAMPETPAPAPSPWSAAALGAWVVPVWALGAAAALVPALLGAVSLWFLARSSHRVTDGPWMALLGRLSAGLGLRRRVVLLTSDRRSMPMAWGVRRPKLLIPAEAERWPPGCLCAVLLHELAHVKRWDCLTQLVMRIACSLYWFNPLAWVAFRCAVAEHERACDDVVLASGGKPSEYAEYLLDVASRLPGRRLTLGVAIALARPSRLEGRLLAILDGTRSRRAVTRAVMLGAILALAAVLVPLAVMRPTVQAEQAAAESDPAADRTTVVPASADGAAKETVPSPQPGVGGGVRLAEWGETDHGIRLRLTAPEKEYQKIATLPLWAELENIGATRLAPIGLWEAKVTAEVLDADGWPLRVRPPAEVAPWEGRMTAGGLTPGAAIRWTVGFDRFEFLDRPAAGTTVRLRLRVSGRDFNVASQWVELSLKDSPPAPVGPGDLPDVWAGFMDLVYREDGSAGPRDKPLDPSGRMHAGAARAVHVDGRTGRVTVTIRSGGDDDWLGRHEAVADRADLDRLAALLKRHAVWKLADLKPPLNADGLRLAVGTESLRLSLSVVGRLLDCEFPLDQASKEPALLAIRQEMWALAAKTVARAREDQKGWGPLSDEGVQSRLRAEKHEWPVGQTPALKADVRNLGMLDLSVAQAQQGWEVEVDGQWHQRTGDKGLKYSPFEPGRAYQDIQFTLGSEWRSKDGDKPLRLGAGKHTVRVAPVCMTREEKTPMRAMGAGNVVEIEIRPDTVATAGSTSASAGMPDTRPAPTGDNVAGGGTSLLRGGDMTDAGLKTYARLKNREGVEVDSISGSKITDVGLRELRDFRNLRALNLACAGGVTDAGMKELKGCTGLRELRLVNTGVSNAGLAELKGLDALEALYLSGPKITDAGLSALKDFKGLREVCLLGPTFTDAGLKELKDLKGLRMLHLCSAGITDAGVRELLGLTGLQALTLSDTRITDAGLKELKDLKGLRQLGLQYTRVTDPGMRDVAGLKALRMLDLTYTNVTDAGLKELEGLKGLRELHCVGAAVTKAGVERLRKALPEAKIIAGEGAGSRPSLEPPARSAPAAPPHPAATPILKIRATDGAAVADVHGGAVRVRLGDKTVEGPTIIISLDPGTAGAPRKGIVLGVRDGAVRMSADGTETLGAKITIHPDGRAEVSSREATDGSLTGPAPAGPDAVRPAEPGRAESGNALPSGDGRAPADRRVFPLTYREADETDGVVRGNTFQHCLPGRPAEAKAVPADLSGQALYFLLPIGGRKVLAVLDTSPSPRLFVDVAGTGDLAAAQPLPAKPWGPTHQFGPVAIPVDGQAGRVVRVRFLSSLDKDIAVAPAGYVAGEVSLDGQPYRVALIDHSLSGRYDNVLRGEGDSDSARGETYLAIDLNQDGRLEPPGASASETFDLLPTLHVGNAYYGAQVAPDGSSMALTDAKPDFGTLDTGCADLSLALVGEYGFRRLSGSGGKWQVPAGWHAATGATLTRSDAAGSLWSLHGVSSWGRLARFDVRAGQMLSLRAGPPLAVKVHPSGLQPNGMIHFALALVGQAGEDYNAAPKRGGVPQPPRFRVLDEAGRTLGSGVFNPGTEGTYSWCWWRVPAGVTGKYRVEVEGDFGPFEIARSEPEWFSIR